MDAPKGFSGNGFVELPGMGIHRVPALIDIVFSLEPKGYGLRP